MTRRWRGGLPRLAFGWRRGLAYAVLWALAVGTPEGAVEISSIYTNLSLSSLAAGYMGWLFAGVVFTAFAAIAVPSLQPLQLMAATVAMAVLITYTEGVSATGRSLFAPDGVLPISPVFLGWSYLAYGGLFVGACALGYRAERARSVLGRAEVARSRTQALFTQAQLAGLQGSVDPAFLLRVLSEMQRRYATDAASADRLLDQLVSFLRLAMPGVRSGQSTLAAEVAVVRSYARLASELEPGRARWHGDIDPSLADLPFPPLLLLPLFDQLDAGSSAPAAVTMTTVRGPSEATVTLHGTARPGWLADELLHRLQVGLKAAHGSAAAVVLARAAEAGAPALSMTLPLSAPSPRAAAAAFPTPQPKGATTWTEPLPTTT